MRVVSGTAGGLRLDSPKKVELRPTQDRIKQVIFSSLAAIIEGTRVLDLYAGTGGLGIEALSRGAGSATFVEKEKECVGCIRANLEKCHFKGDIIHRDAIEYLRGATSSYDMIFLDPPYEKIRSSLDLHPLLSLLHPRLNPGGTLVWEHFSGQTFTAPAAWSILRHRIYGETGLTFLQPVT